MMTSTGVPSGFGLGSPTPPGINFADTAAPIFKPPSGMTYGSGIGASSGIGSGVAPTLGRFAGGLLGGLMGGGGGGSASRSQPPQPSRMAGSPEFLKALQAFASNNSGSGFTDMGDGFSMYQPPRPGAEVTEKTKSEGGGGGSRSTGSRIAGGATGALGGAATGAQLGSVVPGIGTGIGAGIGAVAGGLGGLFG